MKDTFEKLEIPNYKHQIPKHFFLEFGIWNLGFGAFCFLEFGIWNLVLFVFWNLEFGIWCFFIIWVLGFALFLKYICNSLK
ncbi:MAG: hypothetical protein CL524_00215 [Aequorivita sp.]|uniref:Uncharacterized protein n=1 Tax=Aequorivita vladivostokensis TaxID=171194 RepID=A0ABR5DG80_9FLAO|nr:hypothetical protein MB09_12090 [Aequorivita vladivostokensis]MAB55954.1 hypothetical protein [Aequorivita sp.]MBF31267.1 hypothetical protein [Aequorivita sp.]|tara:strand:- start:3282 stop:3524 length:243 start_codon:yes stop_codon:yes gene_type:complete